MSSKEMTTAGMSDSDKLDILIEKVSELVEKFEELKTNQEEVVEKLGNLSLPGGPYEVFGEA